MPQPDNDESKGIDALEKLAYLIAEEFVRESERCLAQNLLQDPALKEEYRESKPKVFAAGRQDPL